MKERNTAFTILSAIAMTLVMLGHLDYDLLTFGGVFPYYSYHVLIFVFISGYFYKSAYEDSIFQYILHKARTLLLPYFIWNLVYGIIANILHGFAFEIGEELNVWNLLVAPFVGGHQFMYNATAWFVPALFLLEICNVCARKVLKLCRIRNEAIIFVLYLAVGIFAVYMSIRGSVYDYYKIPARIMIMAPGFGLGRLYAKMIEKHDNLSSYIYIPALFIINLALKHTQGGLAYSVVWATGFANGPVMPFVTMITGIALWLRIAKIVASLLEKDRFKDTYLKKAIMYYGTNTYSVMMHQLIIFMGIKEVFGLLAERFTWGNFDNVAYHQDVYYTYVPGDIQAFKLIYLVIGIALSLLICRIIEGSFIAIKNGVKR